MLQTGIYSSLSLIAPLEGTTDPQLTEYSICKNEAFSFQMAYKLVNTPADEGNEEEKHFFVRIISDLPISLYHVGCVPVLHKYKLIEQDYPIGMYPDILYPKQANPDLLRQNTAGNPGYRFVEKAEQHSLAAYSDSWGQLWFTVNENSQMLDPGIFSVKLELYDLKNCKIGENQLTLEVLDAALPEQTLYYTNWFHNDCLADFYDLPVFSDEYYAVFRNFVRTAVKNGMNMLLLPAFTPPLDTAIGEERMTVQLVDVERTGGEYRFDFSPMKRYIEEARKAGIRFFEHSHFFTQWGAAHAPKIMGKADGEYRKLFGWETDAASEAYVSFLRAYIPAVRKFLRSEGLEDTTLFHISDEPGKDVFESYQKAVLAIRDLLQGCIVGDALSDYSYYESGLVSTPIARSSYADEFVERCEELWIYYFGADCVRGLSNRLIQFPRERNRSMGWQLYWAKAKGFLHWGYNFYYGRLSHGLYDPAQNPCCGFPNAGTSYSVYPGRGGTALQSIHQKVFADALSDHRALLLLESLAGRSVCINLIRELIGEPSFYTAPEDSQTMLDFRQAVNRLIQSYIN